MPKYTPGPWEWSIEGGDIEIRMGDATKSPGNHLSHNSFKYVDMIETYKKEQKEQVIANADLMTAAPDLLEECEKMLNEIKVLMEDCNERDKYIAQKIRNKSHKFTIEKAKGEI